MAAARVFPAVPGWVRGVGCGCLLLCWWVYSARAAGNDSILWGTVTEVHSATHFTVSSPESGLLNVRLMGVEAPEPANPNGQGETASASRSATRRSHIPGICSSESRF